MGGLKQIRKNWKGQLWNQLLFHATTAAIAIVLGLGVAAIALNVKFLNPVKQAMADFEATDINYQMLLSTGVRDTNQYITIVDVTDLYSRAELAICLDDIVQLNPSVVMCDIVFQNWREDSIADLALAGVCSAYDNIVTNCFVIDSDPGDVENKFEQVERAYFKEQLPMPYINEKTSWEGTECSSFMPREMYGLGTKRNTPLAFDVPGGKIASFPWLAASRYLGEDVMPPSTTKLVNINYTPTHFVRLMPEEVSQHPELICGRLILFGAMNDQTDMHYTPLGKIAGLEVLAYAIQTLLAHNDAKTIPDFWQWVITFLLVMISSWVYVTYRDLLLRVRPNWLKITLSFSYFKMLNLFLWMGFWMLVFMLVLNEYQLQISPTAAFGCMALIPYALEFHDILFKKKKDKSETKNLITPAPRPLDNIAPDHTQPSDFDIASPQPHNP